jgi:uracil phosphoribosyltransferase
MAEIVVVNHPLIQDKLTLMRSRNTDFATFRALCNEISTLIAYEATKDLPTYNQEIETPLDIKASFPMIKSQDIALVSILRAGTGMLDGVLKLIPSAYVGHMGLYRDPKNYSVIEYYFKMPQDIESKTVFILDPIIATGNSAVAAVARIKEISPQSITFLSILAAPEGLEYFKANHPDVTLYVAAIDQGLNARNYIVPGLGDAGDRMFGTA